MGVSLGLWMDITGLYLNTPCLQMLETWRVFSNLKAFDLNYAFCWIVFLKRIEVDRRNEVFLNFLLLIEKIKFIS